MHSPECFAVQERKGFILNLREATKFREHGELLEKLEGTQTELEEAWSELKGCYNEYHNDGDQMSDACTCDHFGVR